MMKYNMYIFIGIEFASYNNKYRILGKGSEGSIYMLYVISYFTFLEATGTTKAIFPRLYLHQTKNLDSFHNGVLFYQGNNQM